MGYSTQIHSSLGEIEPFHDMLPSRTQGARDEHGFCQRARWIMQTASVRMGKEDCRRLVRVRLPDAHPFSPQRALRLNPDVFLRSTYSSRRLW